LTPCDATTTLTIVGTSVTSGRVDTARAAARRRLAAALLLLIAAWPLEARAADVGPVFRLFLTNGTAVACLGEFARVGDRVVFTLSLGDGNPSPLMSLPASAVDWSRTDEYAVALRASRYGETRGEADFAVLTGDVARVLNEIAFTSDPARKLAMAQEARRRLASWPADHYNYRGADVRQILQLVDEAISELRAQAGETQFDLNLVANVEPPPADTLLPEPSLAESLANATALADMADDPAERVALLESLTSALDKSSSSLAPAVGTYLEVQVRDKLRAEQATEASYTRVTGDALSVAHASAGRADVRGVEKAIARVEREDARLGRKRPREVSAVLATLRDELDAARRLRLARDQWSVKVSAYRRYQQEVKPAVSSLDLLSGALDDIKRLAGPDAAILPRLDARASDALQTLDHVVPPPDLAEVHTLIQTAARLAAQAIATRQAAVSTAAMDKAWQASSAGSLMLLDRARQDLAAAVAPPGSK
jgi:hypothetical protein